MHYSVKALNLKLSPIIPFARFLLMQMLLFDFAKVIVV